MNAITTAEALSPKLDSIRAHGDRVVFTNGCFDLLHTGHLRLLSKAAAFGDCLVVAINDDSSVSRLKGPERPIYSVEERAEILRAVRWVDFVTVFSEDTPAEIIRQLRPDVLVKGAEYEESDIVGSSFVKGYGGVVRRIPMKRGQSTRRMVKRILE